MTSPLEKLAKLDASIHEEPADSAEYEGLVHSGRVRLADARRSDIALESRFDLAYNASHAISLAALRRCGYRSGHRYLVFQLLPHTLGLGPDVWRVLDKCHKVRNQGEYEGFLNIDERLIADLIAAATTVLEALEARGPL